MRYTLSPTWSSEATRRPIAQKAAAPRLVPRGRDALRAVFAAEGWGPGDKVLLPAFGCPSIADAALASGLTPVFYPVGGGLELDAGRVLSVRDGGCLGLVYINYFGIPQNHKEIGKLRETGLVIIEDATHSLFSDGPEAPWDHRFSSLRKLLPVPCGCLLESRRPAETEGQGRGTMSQKAQSLLRSAGLRIAAVYQRRPSGLLKWFLGTFRYGPEAALETENPMTYVSPAVARELAAADPGEIRGKRRGNYLALLNAIDPATGLRPVFPCLPEGACPLGLPVTAAMPKLWRRALEALDVEALPLWSLHPSVDASIFREEKTLADGILVLPCGHHHGPDDMKRIAELVNGLAG